MNKREARIAAMGFAVSLLEREVNNSNEMYDEWGKDGIKVHNALEDFIAELGNRVDRLTQTTEK